MHVPCASIDPVCASIPKYQGLQKTDAVVR